MVIAISHCCTDLGAFVSQLTATLAIQGITRGPIVTLAFTFTAHSEGARWAGIGTDGSLKLTRFSKTVRV